MGRPSKTGTRGLCTAPDGTFYCDLRVRGPEGERTRIFHRFPPGTRKPAAAEWVRRALNAGVEGSYKPPAERAPTLEKAMEQYLDWAKAHRHKSLRTRESLGKVLVQHLGASRSVDKITRAVLEDYVAKRTAAGTGPATINRSLAYLRHFAELAANTWKWITREQAAEIAAVPFLREPPPRDRVLVGDEAQRILAECPPNFRPLVAYAFLSGVRLDNVRTLRKDAVSFASGFVTLVKTKSGRRTYVPIHPLAEIILRACIDRSPGEFVFTNRDGVPYSPHVGSMFRRACKRAGVVGATFHDIRRSVGTALAEKGVPVELIAKILGHSTVEVTRAVYSHPRAALKAAVTQLPAPGGISAPLPAAEKVVTVEGPELPSVPPA